MELFLSDNERNTAIVYINRLIEVIREEKKLFFLLKLNIFKQDSDNSLNEPHFL